ncbi:hypothetical protein ACFFIF_08050 [Vagococcus entomophilus]|nr:hypothetical protein [Vagococcus entomophilus]
MDKIYIDSKEKITVLELPQHGEIKLIIQDGKVIRKVVISSEKMK